MNLQNSENRNEPKRLVDFINEEPWLLGMSTLDQQDATLSRGEHAVVTIVQTLMTHTDALDAAQLTAISKTLDQYTVHVTELEAAAWRRINQE